MPIAHALIEDPRDGRKYQRGDEVPTDLPGFEELIEGGSVSEIDYDPVADEVGPPATLEIDGITYVQAADSADNGDAVEVQ